jgi:hypothetical protein
MLRCNFAIVDKLELCQDVMDMNKLMTGMSSFTALLLVFCFGLMAIMCFAGLSFGGVVGSNDDHCADKMVLSGCLMSELGSGAVTEVVLVSIFLLVIGGVAIVLRYKAKELQESVFRCWRRFWCVESLYFYNYLVVLFSRGIVRSKIYG